MECVHCNYDKTKVVESAKDKSSMIRARVCQRCGKMFYTEETAGQGTVRTQADLRRQLHNIRWEQKKRKRAEAD